MMLTPARGGQVSSVDEVHLKVQRPKPHTAKHIGSQQQCEPRPRVSISDSGTPDHPGTLPAPHPNASAQKPTSPAAAVRAAPHHPEPQDSHQTREPGNPEKASLDSWILVSISLSISYQSPARFHVRRTRLPAAVFLLRGGRPHRGDPRSGGGTE